MNIAIVGTGYVGLVTGVCLSEVGHRVTCVDIDEYKIALMSEGVSPIYEPGIEELMRKNMQEGRLFFTTDYEAAFYNAEAIYIAVGTPPREDGSANLIYVEAVARKIAEHMQQYTVVVTKSTVPVGTNHRIRQMIEDNMAALIPFDVVSNPEFLREGSAVHDAFYGDRIVIGADSDRAVAIVQSINEPFGIPIFRTDVRSAELIKYASNAFLATKISYINEISNLCEKLGVNVEDVSSGMGMDKRIGNQFLKAGIGYGGSCFPKDTKALIQIAGNHEHEFTLLKSVIDVNNKQQNLLFRKAIERNGTMEGKTVAVLGLSFKPFTDDMRESASIVVTEQLINNGATVVAYDPIAMENAKMFLDTRVTYAPSLELAVTEADCIFLLTDWPHFINMDLLAIRNLMKTAVIYDGRNCFNLNLMKEYDFEYHSIGRPSVYPVRVMSR